MKKVIIVILSIIFVTILCIISKKENNINENLYTFYVENQKVSGIPSNEYVFEKAICNNGATLTWNGGL